MASPSASSVSRILSWSSGAILIASLAGCTEHRYTIEVETDGRTIERSVHIERASGEFGTDDAELARLVATYGKAVDEGTSRASKERHFRGRFQGSVPDDLGGWGQVHQSESPLGRVTFYHELIRPTPDLSALLERSSRALDTLVDVTLETFGEEYGKDAAWPSLRAVVDGPVRADLHHLHVAAWALLIADGLQPTSRTPTEPGVPRIQGAPMAGALLEQDWWKAELVQRGYLTPDQAAILLLDGEPSGASDGLMLVRAVEHKCLVERRPDAAELLGRIRIAFGPEGEPGKSGEDASVVAARLSARAEVAVRARWPELAEEAAAATASQSKDGTQQEGNAASLLAAIAIPDGTTLMAWDDVDVRLTIPGAVVATNGAVVRPLVAPDDGTPATEAPPAKEPAALSEQSDVRWSGILVPRPGQAGRVGLRAWAIAVEPHAQEQRRLWGAVRLNEKDLALWTAHFASLSPAEAQQVRDALEASRDEIAWRRWAAQRTHAAQSGERQSESINACVDLLERAIFTAQRE